MLGFKPVRNQYSEAYNGGANHYSVPESQIVATPPPPLDKGSTAPDVTPKTISMSDEAVAQWAQEAGISPQDFRKYIYSTQTPQPPQEPQIAATPPPPLDKGSTAPDVTPKTISMSDEAVAQWAQEAGISPQDFRKNYVEPYNAIA